MDGAGAGDLCVPGVGGGGSCGGRPALAESGRLAAYALALTLLVATLALVQSFITRDFSLAYVAAHSNLAMPNIYTWVAFYAGNEGSLLYIAFALAALSAAAIRLAPAATRPTLAWTVAILMFIEVFFLAVMAFMANPFQRLPFPAADGQGINPLLTHFGMFLHPPALMAGLAGISIPMAFALGGLLGGRGGDEWIDAGRGVGSRHLGAAGGGAAAGILVGVHHPGVGRVLVLGSGGECGLYAVDRADGVCAFHNGAETAGDVPNVEHSDD